MEINGPWKFLKLSFKNLNCSSSKYWQFINLPYLPNIFFGLFFLTKKSLPKYFLPKNIDRKVSLPRKTLAEIKCTHVNYITLYDSLSHNSKIFSIFISRIIKHNRIRAKFFVSIITGPTSATLIWHSFQKWHFEIPPL